jgi:hypothetical protein
MLRLSQCATSCPKRWHWVILKDSELHVRKHLSDVKYSQWKFLIQNKELSREAGRALKLEYFTVLVGYYCTFRIILHGV